MDMEVDTGAHFNLEAPQDEDLINYESDSGVPVDSHAVDAMEEPTVNNGDASKLGDSAVQEGEPVEHHQDHGEEHADANDDDQSFGEGAQSPERPPVDAIQDDLPLGADQEIDYEVEETADAVEDNESTETKADRATQQDVINAVPVEVSHAETDNHEAEQDEISWEHDVDFSSGANEENEVQEDEDVIKEYGNKEEDTQDPNTAEAFEGDNQEATQPDVDAGSDDSAHHGGDDDSEPYPNIIVQYKGDTFPFFSHSSEGFFSELKVLDSSIETVLAGFRSELQNEISTDDDIVFQVDELGLEFTEVSLSALCQRRRRLANYRQATNQDSLAHFTLRQIIEVFDLLVKNQDPASSRTLYTFLFTRPNPSRRFDVLVESATSGKRLDDISYLFESHVHNGSPDGKGSHDDTYDDQLEHYESAEDETVEATQEADISAGTGEQPGDSGIGIDGLADVDSDHFLESLPGEVEGAGDLVAEADDNINGGVSAFGKLGTDLFSMCCAATDPFEDEQLEISNEVADSFGESLNTNDEIGNEIAPTIGEDITFGGDELIETAINDESVLSVPENHSLEQPGENEEDELDEIDWREDDEIADEGDVASTTGKRSRGDDDAGAEDEQGKRPHATPCASR